MGQNSSSGKRANLQAGTVFFIINLLWQHVVSCVLMHLFHLQGNLYEFLRLTGWRGSKVLYFGDHIYSDLAVSIMTNRFIKLRKLLLFRI